MLTGFDALHLISIYQNQLLEAFAVFLRLAPAYSLFPAYGDQVVPRRFVLVTIIFLSFALAPVSTDGIQISSLSRSDLFLFMLSETFFGFFLGFLVRSITLQIQVTGSTISGITSITQMFQSSGEGFPALSHFLKWAALGMFFASNLHLLALSMVHGMYKVIPLGAFSCIGCVAETMVSLATWIFNGGITLAGGFLSLFFLFQLASGFINKAMPQFMVAFIFVPLFMLAAIAFMAIHIDLILDVWVYNARDVLQFKWPFEFK